MKILITHGHTVDGKDKGAVAWDKTTEGQLNRDIAFELQKQLQNFNNVQVDVKQEKDNNSKFVVMSRNGYDLALSIHHNSASNNNATGTEVLYKNNNSKEIATILSKSISVSLNVRDRGIKYRDNLHMLNINFDVLIEVCFINNKNDFGANYDKEKICENIAKEIKNIYNLEEKEIIKVEKAEFLCNSEKQELNRILYKDKNYIELRELEKLGAVIEWDNINKIPIIEF